jgi:hypothetical protein
MYIYIYDAVALAHRSCTAVLHVLHVVFFVAAQQCQCVRSEQRSL